MSPLSHTKHFIEQIKYDKIPEEYQMMPIDVKSLFTSILLNKTIEITSERIYDRKEINTDIPKTIIKEMLLLCTKDVQFLFKDKIYQTDGVTVGYPLGPIVAGIFIVELETTIVPKIR